MRQIQEPMLVQAFIAQTPIEGLEIGVVVGLTGLDESRRHLVGVCPGHQYPVTGKAT